MKKPVPSLEQDRPIKLIARGKYRRVADVPAGLRDRHVQLSRR